MRGTLALAAMLIAGPMVAASPGDPPPWVGSNVLLIIADDLGVDRVGAYGEHPDPGHTPVIDLMAASGVMFRNAWSSPSCSPTRAGMLTGRYGFRTGVGAVIPFGSGTFELPVTEVSLPEVLAPTYSTAVVGKWHMAVAAISGFHHPQLSGFDHHRGPIGNLEVLGGPEAYYDYDKIVDGVSVRVSNYATTETVDDTLQLINSFSEPWFIWLAFNAPHAPYHAPPAHLTTLVKPDGGDGGTPKKPAGANAAGSPAPTSPAAPSKTRVRPGATDQDVDVDIDLAGTDAAVPFIMKSMTEAMDTEMGRLFQQMPKDVLTNTVVIFLGDNGTTGPATTAPFLEEHSKNTPYEGGINVPLIIVGPGIRLGVECDALVNTVDIFATVAEIANVSAPSGVDSVSLVPYFTRPKRPSIRDWAYSELFRPNGFERYTTWKRVIRDDRYKLHSIYIQSSTPTRTEFYDLLLDPFEQDDLMLRGPLDVDQQQAFDQLTLQLDTLQ